MAKKKKIVRKGKKKKTQRPSSQKWKLYKIEGEKVIRLRPFCPRCGPGVLWRIWEIDMFVGGAITQNGRRSEIFGNNNNSSNWVGFI